MGGVEGVTSDMTVAVLKLTCLQTPDYSEKECEIPILDQYKNPVAMTAKYIP